MNKRDLVQVIKQVSGPNTEIQTYGEWLTTTCPLAQWRHETGHDSHPSFGYHINDHGVTICNCFTCGFKRPVEKLVRELNQLTGGEFDTLQSQVEKQELLGGDIPEWEETGYNRGKESEPVKILDESMLEAFQSAVGNSYLHKRGLTDSTIEQLGLLYDDWKDDDSPRIVFPLRDFDNRLVGLTGRATQPSRRKVKDYWGTPKRRLLLGMNDLFGDYVMLVEGPMDYAKMRQYGHPALAILHSTVTEEQAALLKQINKPVYIFSDNDLAGAKVEKAAYAALANHVPLIGVDYPEGANDPDELTPEEVKDMMANGVLL